VTDGIDEVRRLLTRVDDLIKAAPNRSDPAVAYRSARALLEEAEWQLADVDRSTPRDELTVAVGLRHDDLNRLMLLLDDPSRGTMEAPAAPQPLPQPDRQAQRRAREAAAARIPPGQRLVTSWPVLHVGPVPRSDLTSWRFSVSGLIEQSVRWTWAEFRALPRVSVTTDFHCVTGWSRLDNRWEGVRFRDLTEVVGVSPRATHVVIGGGNDYTANVDLPSLLEDDVLFAWSHDGRDLPPEHGGPLRLVVPSRYAWKSVKWVTDLEFRDLDAPGYWEMRGYHNVADPWMEQRYA